MSTSGATFAFRQRPQSDPSVSLVAPAIGGSQPNRELQGRGLHRVDVDSGRLQRKDTAMVYIGTIALSGSGLEGPCASRHRFPLYGVSAKIRRPARAQFNAFAIEIEILILRHPHMACATAETSGSWGKNPRSLSLFRMFSNCA